MDPRKDRLNRNARATQQEIGRINASFLANVVRTVVVELVIVPNDEPRAARVHRLQQRVRFVLRVANAIVVERAALAANMLPDSAILAGIFVDVVAQVQHQVEFFLGHVRVSGVQARLEMLAGSKGESHLRRLHIHSRQRARAADGALRLAARKTVPVPAIRLQPRQFDMNGMP